jgi:hypothetical protein
MPSRPTEHTTTLAVAEQQQLQMRLRLPAAAETG